LLADDHETAIFEPDQSFAPGETVTVTISPGIRMAQGEVLGGAAFEFTISLKAKPLMDIGAVTSNCDPSEDVVGLPDDFPTISVTVPASGTAEGYLLLANLRWEGAPSARSYLLILDDSGEPVYYKRCLYSLDFKKQPDGSLTYWDYADNAFTVMDASYAVVDTVQAGNGYLINRHDLLILPNGNYLFTIYDPQPVDMSQVVPGGDPNATVVGLVIQEMDASKNVVFEWRSWDHFEITDSNQDLTASHIDYVHGNSVELDSDGNLLICSRHLDEITKIDRGTLSGAWGASGTSSRSSTTLGGSPTRTTPGGYRTATSRSLTTGTPYRQSTLEPWSMRWMRVARPWSWFGSTGTYPIRLAHIGGTPSGCPTATR